MNGKLRLVLLGMTLCVALGGGSAALAEAPKDVRPDHPAYRAVQTLIEQGYVGVFQDGSFQGDRPVDRYTLATVVARLMSDVQSGKLVLPNDEMKTLRQLATEFRAELVEVAGQTNALAQAQEKTAGEVTVLREDTTKLVTELYKQQEILSGLSADLEALKSEAGRQAEVLKALEDRAADAKTLGAIQVETEALRAQAQALIAKQGALEGALGDLRAEFESYRRASEADIASLKADSRNHLIGGVLVAALLFLSR